MAAGVAAIPIHLLSYQLEIKPHGKLVSKNISKAQENNVSQCAVVECPRQTNATSVCA